MLLIREKSDDFSLLLRVQDFPGRGVGENALLSCQSISHQGCAFLTLRSAVARGDFASLRMFSAFHFDFLSVRVGVILFFTRLGMVCFCVTATAGMLVFSNGGGLIGETEGCDSGAEDRGEEDACLVASSVCSCETTIVMS